MDTKSRKYILFQIFSYLLLAACLFGTINYVRLKKNNTISADESSEMLLGRILADENSLISKNWYYSTELEVINTNVFYALFFHITDSWHMVRVCATFSMYLLLLFVYFGLSRVCHFRDFFAITAAVLFIPFSIDYYDFILKGAYYFPVITTSFFTLLLAELYLQLSGKKAGVLLIFSFIFSLVTGLGGLRQLFITYIPLILASAFMLIPKIKKPNSEKWLIYSAVSLIGSGIGWVINAKVLAGIYHFDTWSTVTFSEFSSKRIGEIIDGVFISLGRTLGYTTGRLFSDSLLNNAVCGLWILITVASIWYAFRNHQKVSPEYVRLVIFTVCSYVFYIVFYSFTTMYHRPRYNIPIICLSFPLAALFMGQIKWKKAVSTVLLTALVLLTAVRGLNYYVSNWNYDRNVELRRISKVLVSEGYYNGYATFWYANNLTEFSNGKLDVWSLIDGTFDKGIKLVTDIDHTYQWLQKVCHDTEHPVGKTYLFFTAGENRNNNWKEQLEGAEIIYSSDHYVVYGFEDYYHLIDTLYPGYDFVFGEGQWLENGEDVGEHRELFAGGLSYGPYLTLWPGKYELTIRGSGLDEAEVRTSYGEERRSIYMEPIEQNGNLLKYEFELKEKRFDTEVLIQNPSDASDSIIEIDSISLMRIKGSADQL